MRLTTCLVLIAALCAQSTAAAAQKSISPALEVNALKQMIAGIPLGSRIKLQLNSGKRMTATLMAVDADGVVVKRASRVPEPAVRIAFTDLRRLERDEKSSLSIGKAIGIGLAAGAGAIVTLFFIAMSIDD